MVKLNGSIVAYLHSHHDLQHPYSDIPIVLWYHQNLLLRLPFEGRLALVYP